MKFIVVMIDYFTKWIEVKELAKITIEVICNFILIDIICHYGIPMVIITDNNPQFLEKKMFDFYSM